MKTPFSHHHFVGLLVSCFAIFTSASAFAQLAATPWVGPLQIRFSAPLQSNTPIIALVPVPSCGYETGPVVAPEDVNVSRNAGQIDIAVGHGSFACFAVGTRLVWEYAVPLGTLAPGDYLVDANVFYAESPTTGVELSAPLSIAVGPDPITSTALPSSSTWSGVFLALVLGVSGLLLARRRLHA